MSPYLDYGDIRLLNVPHAKEVADEVIAEDCYRVSEFPVGARVLDVGAFYGEFAVMAAVRKGCLVHAFEPAANSFDVCSYNVESNPWARVVMEGFPVGATEGVVEFNYNKDHPAGSNVSRCGDGLLIEQASIKNLVVNRQINVVKLDCEGSEVEIFSDPSWVDNVKIVTMEFHNHDGDHYASILRERGFKVDITGTGPKPRPQWDKSMAGGLLFATKL